MIFKLPKSINIASHYQSALFEYKKNEKIGLLFYFKLYFILLYRMQGQRKENDR